MSETLYKVTDKQYRYIQELEKKCKRGHNVDAIEWYALLNYIESNGKKLGRVETFEY